MIYERTRIELIIPHGTYIMTDDLHHLRNFVRGTHFKSMARSSVLFIGFNLIVWRLNTVLGSHRSKNTDSRNTYVIYSQGFLNDGPAIPNDIPTYNLVIYPSRQVENSNPACNAFMKIFWSTFFEQILGKSTSSKQTGYRRDISDLDKTIETDDQLTNSDSKRSASELNDNDKRNDNNQTNDVVDLKLKEGTTEYGGRRVVSDSSREENKNDDDSTFEPNINPMDFDADNDNDVINYRRYSHPNDPYFSSFGTDDTEKVETRGH